MLVRFIFALALALQSFAAVAADVRFHNHIPLGLNGWRLSPHNGNAIRVWDPTAAAWVTRNLVITSPGVVEGVVSSAYIDDVPGQNMPYNVIHRAFLKMDASGNLYVNWLPWSLSSYAHGPEGFYVDTRTGKGHLVGMAIRVPTYEIQGQYFSEWLVSYYNRGSASFFSHPACSVVAGAGWQPCGQYVEALVWQDDFPKITATMNLTNPTAGASLQVRLMPTVNGVLGGGDYGAQYNQTANRPYLVSLTLPGAPLAEGLWRYNIDLQTDAGTVTAGAVLNSVLDVHGKF
jgi:hypothetical protein